MPKENDEFVVYNYNENELYLTGIITGGETAETYQWGNEENAIVYGTLQAAEAKAAQIGGGTVGTTRP